MKVYPEILFKLYDFCISFCNITSISRHPTKSNESYKPFFIIGSGRSGNTLLRRMINNHSILKIPPETYVLGKAIRRYRQNRGMRWNDLVEYVFSAFEFHPEFETFDISLRPLVQELKNTPRSNRNLAYMLDRFYHYSCQKTGSNCVRWGDKTPLNTFYLERIFAIFPDAKFIHILRDGCDVVSSYVNSGIYKSLKEAAERWIASVELVEKFYMSHPSVGITIRYEELVSDPKNTLINLCGFLGVDFEEQMLANISESNSNKMGDVEKRAHHSNVMKPVSVSSIGRGRAELSGEQKLLVDKIIGDQLKRLGYENCTS